MADASNTSLLPIIVGGLLALGGGVVAGSFALFTRYLQSVDDETKRRAQKFEELVQVLHEHKHWLDITRSIRVYGAVGTIEQSPIHKAIAIMTVYFPEHYLKLNELDTAADQYEIWMMVASQKRMKGEIANLNEGHREASDHYLKNFHEFMRELREYAKKEFQSARKRDWRSFRNLFSKR